MYSLLNTSFYLLKIRDKIDRFHKIKIKEKEAIIVTYSNIIL